MTCTGERLAACFEWEIHRPSPVMSAVRRSHHLLALNATAMKTIGAWSPLLSFLIGAAFTGLALGVGFDPDRNITPVLWMCVPGLLVAVAGLRPVLASVIAGIAAFPIVLFAYLALTSGPGNIWPIAMGIHAVIASVPFGLGYGIGMLLNLLVRNWPDGENGTR